ncbi:MAG: large-conductance mechanosensitive channel protein MscL [Candidatus Yonathbacteria bacterium]|nr:large-conductance mechanosensitive channel protein MscL [Candidatus Yonathbacteria bacterium]NTW47745.1 large-conductance mechanosensitive channel protein MscL [Candidatus Yonathbacteria bacterium]
MSIIQEFKEFAVKGNAIDMAVGIVIGSAFGTIVKSLVDDIIMPPFGLLLGGVDFSNLFVNLSQGSYESLSLAKDAGAATINYGLFVNALISFIIIAWALFMIVKATNKLKKAEPVAEVAPMTKECPFCKMSIHKDATRCPHCTAQL